MAHREVDYQKMAEKFLSCHSGKSLRSFCYREKLDYHQMLNAIHSRVSQEERSAEELCL